MWQGKYLVSIRPLGGLFMPCDKTPLSAVIGTREEFPFPFFPCCGMMEPHTAPFDPEDEEEGRPCSFT